MSRAFLFTLVVLVVVRLGGLALLQVTSANLAGL